MFHGHRAYFGMTNFRFYFVSVFYAALQLPINHNKTSHHETATAKLRVELSITMWFFFSTVNELKHVKNESKMYWCIVDIEHILND